MPSPGGQGTSRGSRLIFSATPACPRLVAEKGTFWFSAPDCSPPNHSWKIRMSPFLRQCHSLDGFYLTQNYHHCTIFGQHKRHASARTCQPWHRPLSAGSEPVLSVAEGAGSAGVFRNSQGLPMRDLRWGRPNACDVRNRLAEALQETAVMTRNKANFRPASVGPGRRAQDETSSPSVRNEANSPRAGTDRAPAKEAVQGVTPTSCAPNKPNSFRGNVRVSDVGDWSYDDQDAPAASVKQSQFPRHGSNGTRRRQGHLRRPGWVPILRNEANFRLAGMGPRRAQTRRRYAGPKCAERSQFPCGRDEAHPAKQSQFPGPGRRRGSGTCPGPQKV